MKSIIISAFPGTGKSYTTEHCDLVTEENLHPGTAVTWKFHDSDSSKFSWIYDENGNKTDQRDPNFPANYMEHIKSLAEQENNIIFVSTHETVRDALLKAGLNFWIVRPALSEKSKYLERYKERGNDESFIKLIDDNWQTWLRDIDMCYMDNIHSGNEISVSRAILYNSTTIADFVEFIMTSYFDIETTCYNIAITKNNGTVKLQKDVEFLD